MASAKFDIHACSERLGEMSIADSAEYDKQWWKGFLKPLKGSKYLESNTKHLNNPQFPDESLVKRFSEKLSNHHRIITEEKAKAVASAKERLSQLLPCDIEEFENMWKAYEDAKKIKSHRESSGSTWTVEMLASYVRRQDVEFTQFPVSPDVSYGGEAKELIETILEKIDISVKAIGGQLRTECDTRMVLDAILHPLCVSYQGLTILTEQTLKCDSLPTSKLDYIMYYYDQPIGVVEAKRAGCLNDKSVVQLILELFSVSVGNPNLPYFGLLSDGDSFIWLVVCGNKVRFFQEDENQFEVVSFCSNTTLIHNVVYALLAHIEGCICPLKLCPIDQQF